MIERRAAAPVLAGLGLVVAFVGQTGRAEAYPIPPVTLWDLVEKADTIVLATVESEHPIDKGADDRSWTDTIAELSVAESWKGKPDKRIEVPYPAHLICPAPPRYENGLTVLAFLARDEKGAYQTVGFSYGTLYPELPEVPLFRELVRRAETAQALADAGARETARVDWLVRAASAPATRWHGLYALAPAADAVHSYYDGRKQRSITLTPAQLDSLARAFVASPVVDVSLPMMLKVLSGHADAAVDETAVAAVDTVLDFKRPPYWTPELVALTLQRLGKTLPGIRRVRKKTDLGSDPLLGGSDFDAPKMRSRWAEVRKAQPFARRTLDLPPNSGVGRTGPSTPP
jgi:hypothetical protein